MNEKWDRRFLELARFIASWSRDPSTQVGSVIADGKRIVSLGYNGLPQGVEDRPERYADRETKYRMILHAERNAILFASRPLLGTTIYTWPFRPCAACTAMIIQAGIARVVAPQTPPEIAGRWEDDLRLAAEMLREAGVELVLYP